MWNTHLESLLVQKKSINLIPLESESHVWSRVLTSLPAGQLTFLIRARIDCLPTPVTLSRWRYRCDPSFKLCHCSPCTVHYILNCCHVDLNQGRYTWRHDSVLWCLFHIPKSNLPTDTEIYADLPGLMASESPPAAVPLHILVTSARPDIVIIEDVTITSLKLTIPINAKEGLHNAREWKLSKENYIALLGDLQSRGFIAQLEIMEVGSLGHFSSACIHSIHTILSHPPLCMQYAALPLKKGYFLLPSYL